MNSVFKPGDAIVAIMDAYPINIKNIGDRDLLLLPKGGHYTVKNILSCKANTSIIEIELEHSKDIFKPTYWASYFQLNSEAKEVAVYYKF